MESLALLLLLLSVQQVTLRFYSFSWCSSPSIHKTSHAKPTDQTYPAGRNCLKEARDKHASEQLKIAAEKQLAMEEHVGKTIEKLFPDNKKYLGKVLKW